MMVETLAPWGALLIGLVAGLLVSYKLAWPLIQYMLNDWDGEL